MKTLTDDTRDRKFITYEYDRYTVLTDSVALPGYQARLVYSVTNKGTYVRHTLVHPSGKTYTYPWVMTIVNCAIRWPEAEHIKRRVPKRMNF